MAGPPHPQPPPPHPPPHPPQPPPQLPQPQPPSTPPQPPQPSSQQPPHPPQQSSSHMPQPPQPPQPPQQPPHKKRSKAQQPLLAPIALAAIKAKIARFIEPSLICWRPWGARGLPCSRTAPPPAPPPSLVTLPRAAAVAWSNWHLQHLSQPTHPRLLYRTEKTVELTKSIQQEALP